ncbi:MAG: hypothetical protein Q8919_14855, partial [Bacteroidota bacterium]|nr:hypothetical protein [Bacteroidota bacterium]
LGRAMPCPECYGTSSIQESKEYIVFLSSMLLDYNGTTSYYTYWPLKGYSLEGGIFPIDGDGNVLIPSNFFGYGTSLPLALFESDIRKDIDSIILH